MQKIFYILTVLILSTWQITHAQIFNNSQIPESINEDGSAPDREHCTLKKWGANLNKDRHPLRGI